MGYEVILDKVSTVKIGESHKSTNIVNIKINVKTAETVVQTAPVIVTVKVNCGEEKSDLLASRDTYVKSTWGKDAQQTKMNSDSTQPKDKKVWNTGDRGISLPASICLQDFTSNTPPGETEIVVCVRLAKDEDETVQEEFQIKVTKELEASTEPSVRYFLVNPDYIAGQKEVRANFLATDFDTVTLYRNNEQLQTWTKGSENAITGNFPDKPSITSIYRLEAYKNDTKKSTILIRTVQVISAGWNQVALPQGSPVRLFVTDDFSTRSNEPDKTLAPGKKLYGIFKNDEGRYSLFSSATGVDAWLAEGSDVPQSMAESPGVVYDNKLWLIGGSSVDPEAYGNKVWYYKNNKWNEMAAKDKIFSERMGHACIVFPRIINNQIQEEIWVFGGYKGGKAFNDLWIGKMEGNTLVWEPKNPTGGPWPQKRLNPAAATVRDADGPPRVWIFGGAPDPQTEDNLYDLWTTTDGEIWQEEKKNDMDGAIVPAPGRPIGCALVSCQVSGAEDRLLLLGSFQEWATGQTKGGVGNRISSFIFEWLPGNKLWEVRPIFEGWQQFRGDNFYMQAVAFNNFLFVWSFMKEIKPTLKLNILVP